MTPIDALIYGIVEGITEFLPVSSTGHLILASYLMGQGGSEFVKSFDIAIQLGAILAVVVVYFRKLLVDWESMKRIIVGFIPTGVLGLVFYKIVKHYLLGNAWVVVASLIVGGVALLVFERWYTNRPMQEMAIDTLTVDRMSYKQAALIGLAQSLAMIPGISRSAATILGGMATGLSRTVAVEFSFLLAVPTMAAATGLDLLKSYKEFSPNDVTALAIGFAVSFVVALASIHWLLRFVREHNFAVFGWYRIIAGILFASVVLL